ncbi:unnamed protein product [Porites lobata]|uniref:Uncharacterized protein n=1 Tax=Porites lobata TaxID=104759 RepID=A0ABN8SF59_9CNID|nr:unnamed protein product [Porites lobata]
MKRILNESLSDFKRAISESADFHLSEIKKLKFEEPRRFKKKANEDQYGFNSKLSDVLNEAKSSCSSQQLDKVSPNNGSALKEREFVSEAICNFISNKCLEVLDITETRPLKNVAQLMFWNQNVDCLNCRSPWLPPSIPAKFVYSDASVHACGSFIQNENKVFHQNWSPAERKKSSTRRERLKTVELVLISFAPSLHNVFQKGLWQEVFKDPDLQSLSARLQTTILSARAPATVSMYDRAFRRWKEFALSKHELSYLPANLMHVAVYLQYVLESTRSSSSVDTAFYSIKWAHESAGLVSPTDNPLVNQGVRKAAKRILGAKRCHRKEPLSIEIIKDIISAADLSNTLQLRNICLYFLCYAVFF